MGTVIQFERFKEVTGWSLIRIAEYVKDHNWKGFVLHWREGDDVIIERTT